MKIARKTSANIEANVGSLNGLEFQDNGTERLKGSYPSLVTSGTDVINHLVGEGLPLLNSLKERVSRLSSRYFATESAVRQIAGLKNFSLAHLTVNVEASVPLGPIFSQDGIADPIWWVWIGGNSAGRVTSDDIRSKIEAQFHEPANYSQGIIQTSVPQGHDLVVLGSSNRLKALSHQALPHGVSAREINDRYAGQLASLFAERMPVYVADNGNPSYVRDVIAESQDTVLFAVIDRSTDEVVASVANEFTRYPVHLPNGQVKHILICESNDWIKKKGAVNGVFPSVLSAAMVNAVRNNPQAIEVECVPESFRAAGRVGFQPQGTLLRTSHMGTDGENIELQDPTIPERFRKFNSLFLMCLTPQSPTWRFWSQKPR